MTADQIKDIFEPVIKEVCDLVQGQVDNLRAKGGVVSRIILVGGFGGSDYLYRRLKAHFTSAAPPPYSERPSHANSTSFHDHGSIEVMQPPNAWTAVVRGAVLRGLEGNMVISRKARMHYGTSYATVFDEEKHSVSERYWSPLWERWMVSDRMQWHIAKVRVSRLFASPSLRTASLAFENLQLTVFLVLVGRGHLATKPYRLPLYKKLPSWPVPDRHGRPNSLRGRRATRVIYPRPCAHLYADDGLERRASKFVHAAHHHARRRVRQPRLHARDDCR